MEPGKQIKQDVRRDAHTVTTVTKGASSGGWTILVIRGMGTRRNSDYLILFQEIVAYPAARCLLKSEVDLLSSCATAQLVAWSFLIISAPHVTAA